MLQVHVSTQLFCPIVLEFSKVLVSYCNWKNRFQYVLSAKRDVLPQICHQQGNRERLKVWCANT